MIEGVLETLATAAADEATGLNALVRSHNAVSGAYELEAVETVDVWNLTSKPGEQRLPALWIEWFTSPNLELESTGKWRGQHQIRLWYWVPGGGQAEVPRRHLAGMAQVIRKWIDGLPGQGTIAEVAGEPPVRMSAVGWPGAGGEMYALLLTEFVVNERHEEPTA